MSGPSEKAFEAAWLASSLDAQTTSEVHRILDAAHDPVLGLDRSVCLRDVVDALRNQVADHTRDARLIILSRFGGGS